MDSAKPMNNFDSVKYLEEDVISMYKPGASNFTKLISNNSKLLLPVPEHQRRLGMKSQDLYGYLLNEKALGIR